MNKKLFSSFLVALVAVFALSSCNTNTPDPDIDYDIYQIVTISGLTDSSVSMTYYSGQNETLVTLVGSASLKDKVKVGERVLIVYRLPEGMTEGQSGTVRLVAMRTIINEDLLKGKAEDFGGWFTSGLSNVLIWRNGSLINLQAEAMYVKEPKNLKLVVDETTLDQEIPTAYLTFDPDTEVEATWHTAYASFNIAWLWSDSAYKGLKVVYIDGSSRKTAEFKKAETIQPVQPSQIRPF